MCFVVWPSSLIKNLGYALGSYENNFSQLALQQNTLELTLKKIKPEEI